MYRVALRAGNPRSAAPASVSGRAPRFVMPQATPKTITPTSANASQGILPINAAGTSARAIPPVQPPELLRTASSNPATKSSSPAKATA